MEEFFKDGFELGEGKEVIVVDSGEGLDGIFFKDFE
jgi:hypothetical protein